MIKQTVKDEENQTFGYLSYTDYDNLRKVAITLDKPDNIIYCAEEGDDGCLNEEEELNYFGLIWYSETVALYFQNNMSFPLKF